MAELETYHNQKAEDFRTLTTEYLDGEIALYEQVRPFFPLLLSLPPLSVPNSQGRSSPAIIDRRPSQRAQPEVLKYSTTSDGGWFCDHPRGPRLGGGLTCSSRDVPSRQVQLFAPWAA